MNDTEFFDEVFSLSKVMGIFRGMTPEATVAICEAAWGAGAQAVEVPVQDEAGFEALEAAVEAGRRHNRYVGAGTVRETGQLHRVARLGAHFTVAPGLDADIFHLSKELGVPHLPGVATSTEIHTALKLGLLWLKAFPASVLGPDWVKAQLAPFPQARFVATGGIGAGNAEEFLQAGCRGVAIGSAFADAEEISRLVAAGLVQTGRKPLSARTPLSARNDDGLSGRP
ncbi:2-dehydro-3-deoxy-6-phosphogalactonate aldolase [Kineosporia sp. NBRC 101677]|uniref:bifunctional 4-hydroxy-2-oxoglutarate aldolase/2-dehydro-3-deoxy-phosphogluconate aldolase n=1 Tax=Kineosporia sp. NBRC 101677 TaxID=3032197 RepID=UPI0024A3BBFA|nr:bifunctional 4-hydroxy-2-oxoglutarate aldolase/2-dehydro-3-deoxy-phosphogluconate aldolase [Kineosporia sp. NBRC 101677]GLY19647.1 2-dehydro-3-deoxy-6-phosphogalactonate aldolase [Kineosporia sp. NBRC 101677]